jgi:hypothetical protein
VTAVPGPAAALAAGRWTTDEANHQTKPTTRRSSETAGPGPGGRRPAPAFCTSHENERCNPDTIYMYRKTTFSACQCIPPTSSSQPAL